MTFDLQAAAAQLERTPAILDAWLRGLPDDYLHANEGDGTWSPFDVLGHLIDGEETDWIPRARIILAGGADRRFVPFDRFRHRDRNPGRSVAELLDEFARWRRQNVATLRGFAIGPAELTLTGIHPEFGEVTLSQLLATWMVHDLNHLGQIARAMAKRHTDDVGPWRAYLSVLSWEPQR